MSSKKPKSWKDVPFGGVAWLPSTQYKTGDWRTNKPVIDLEKCTTCLFCYIFCPDCSISWNGENVKIDYSFCKGCGICANECPVKAIEMISE